MNAKSEKTLAATLKAGNFGPLLSREPLSGGSICDAYQLATGSGRRLFLKSHPSPPDTLFQCEATGLVAIKQTGTVRTPEIIDQQATYLLLEMVDQGAPSADSWEQLGTELAKMHRKQASCFGFECNNFCGETPQPNPMMDSGYRFFTEARLEYQGKLAYDRGLLEKTDLQRLATLEAHLEELVPQQPPSLLHGDLWGGNILFSAEGQPVLIDPACYWGWREADLAMTTLFGSFDPVFYRAYDSEWPLESGWRERLPLYNLYHLLNHLNLFGRSYLNSVRDTLRRFS